MGHSWVCASPGGLPSAGLKPLHPQVLLGHLCPWGRTPHTHSSLMTDPFGKPRDGDQRGEPHPGLCSPARCPGSPWPSRYFLPEEKALHLAWRKKLGGLLVLPRHLFVSLPASQPPVPPGRMTAWPLNQNKLSLNFGNIRRHVQGRNVCVAQESGARQTPSHSPLPLAASLSPHILLGPPAPHPNPSPFHHPSSQSPIFN